MNSRLLGLLASALLLGAPMAQAVPTLTPIGNVTIGSTLYAVSLLSATENFDQSFDALNPTITFTDEASARTAIEALVDTFGLGFDWNPTCSYCFDGVRVVFGFDDDSYQYWSASLSGIFGPSDQPRGGLNNFSFAQFTAVPAPGALALLSFGLAGLSLSRRRRLG
jgi:hypothetical protein